MNEKKGKIETFIQSYFQEVTVRIDHHLHRFHHQVAMEVYYTKK